MNAILATRPRKLSAEEFLAEFEGVPGKWELVDGEPRMMAGGSRRHAAVARNVLVALSRALRGSGCAAYGSDLGLWLSDRDIRYPDVAVYCSRAELDENPETARALAHPSIIFEVLSPSTERLDRVIKVQKYQAIASVLLIVLIDPKERRFETYARVDEDEWAVGLHAPGATLSVIEPRFEITPDEMFAED
jgi:Uma2 family endonuclease